MLMRVCGTLGMGGDGIVVLQGTREMVASGVQRQRINEVVVDRCDLGLLGGETPTEYPYCLDYFVSKLLLPDYIAWERTVRQCYAVSMGIETDACGKHTGM